jgi:DUF4097 and DUF4098 domain-containing protein YvlB
MRPSIRRYAPILAIAALPLMACAGGEAGQVEKRVAADSKGEVEISNVSGTIDVRGWDRNEVLVTGKLGSGVERLDVETSDGGRHTLVKVVLPRGSSRDGHADIEVQVPRNSTVEVGAVSADVSSKGVLGGQRIKGVSGEITVDLGNEDSEVRTVSGDVTVKGAGKPMQLRVSSVSGGIDVTNVAGRLDIVTVSGDARVSAGDTTEVRGRTTSGNLEVRGKLTKDGRVDVEGVSGEITLHLSTPDGLSTEIESFSGDITGCLAKNVEKTSKYGPGVRLNLRGPDGGPRVRAKTLSGDIDICDK